MSEWIESYAGKRILITGGLGMIGSALAHKLAPAGASVTLVDACIEPYGANLFNIASLRNAVHVSITDIRDKESIKFLVKGQDVVFNLAGQVSHNDSMENPFLDADINYLGHLNVLECLRRYNPAAVVVHAGSRLQFGLIESNPVDEMHPLNPRTPYALNKAAAENMYSFYHEMHGISCVLFRIANPYGVRSQMKHAKYNIVNWFVRQAFDDKVIRIFGDGGQVRDYIYVDDLADALLLAAVTPACHGEIYNVGSGTGTKFRDMAAIIIEVVGSGRAENVPWPKDYFNVETGDYITNIKKLEAAIPWRPETCIQAGIEMTVEYYKQHRQQYW